MTAVLYVDRDYMSFLAIDAQSIIGRSRLSGELRAFERAKLAWYLLESAYKLALLDSETCRPI